MANIKQQKKRVITNDKRRLINAAFKSSMKTAIKAVNAAVKANDKEKATASLSLAFKKLDKALSRGIVHKNYVARNKSALAQKVNAMA